MIKIPVIGAIAMAAIFSGCSGTKLTAREKRDQIAVFLAKKQGFFAVAFKDLGSGRTIYIHAREKFHAASTMKTAVLLEIYKQSAAGSFALSDSLPIRNEFRSIADNSVYTLHPEDDSEQDLYRHIGDKKCIRDLLYLMITLSSNLATNLLVEKVGAGQVTHTLREMKIRDMVVLRGVEDGKAFEKGLNNQVTAYDLALLFEKLARGTGIGKSADEEMISVLKDQQFNEIIPAGLPPGTIVAHKTGWIKGINHDSGIVFLAGGRKYILVLLSKDAADDKETVKTLATVSEMIYHYVQDGK